MVEGQQKGIRATNVRVVGPGGEMTQVPQDPHPQNVVSVYDATDSPGVGFVRVSPNRRKFPLRQFVMPIVSTLVASGLGVAGVRLVQGSNINSEGGYSATGPGRSQEPAVNPPATTASEQPAPSPMPTLIIEPTISPTPQVQPSTSTPSASLTPCRLATVPSDPKTQSNCLIDNQRVIVTLDPFGNVITVKDNILDFDPPAYPIDGDPTQVPYKNCTISVPSQGPAGYTCP